MQCKYCVALLVLAAVAQSCHTSFYTSLLNEPGSSLEGQRAEALIEKLTRYNQLHAQMMYRRPAARRFVLITSLGQWMKNIASAFLVALYTDRALLIRAAGGLSFTEWFLPPCFQWSFEAAQVSLPTSANTYNLTSHVIMAANPIALAWNEYYICTAAARQYQCCCRQCHIYSV